MGKTCSIWRQKTNSDKRDFEYAHQHCGPESFKIFFQKYLLISVLRNDVRDVDRGGGSSLDH